MVHAAIDQVNWSIRHCPPAAPHYALLAEIYRDLGDSRAIKAQEQADRTPPTTAEEWYLHSFACLDVHAALACAKKAIDRAPDYTLARERLVELYLTTGQMGDAVREADALIAGGHDPVRWLRIKAEFLIRQHRYAEAIERCDRILELDESQDHAWRLRSLANLCIARYEDAISDCCRAVSDGDTIPWERYFRATPLWITGRHEEAADDYRAVHDRQHMASFAGARLFLVLQDHARVLLAEGRSEDAQRVQKEAHDALKAVRSRKASPWLSQVLRCVAGEILPDELVNAADASNAAQQCEAYYYAGEACLLRADVAAARDWFQKCVATGLKFDPNSDQLDPMNEYHLARWRVTQCQERAVVSAGADGP
jgi:tetratricopeptide (TPR) repeat protein